MIVRCGMKKIWYSLRDTSLPILYAPAWWSGSGIIRIGMPFGCRQTCPGSPRGRASHKSGAVQAAARGRADLGAMLLKPRQPSPPFAARARLPRERCGAGRSSWEGRPRRDASKAVAAFTPGSPRGRASHKSGAVQAAARGRADLGAMLLKPWQPLPPFAAGSRLPQERCSAGRSSWEGRPRRDASKAAAAFTPVSPRGRASHESGAVQAIKLPC